MATFDEVARGLDRFVNKADETNAALAQAGHLAAEAATLLTEVMQGSGHFGEEFNQAAQAWSEVAKETAELSEIIAAGCQGVESYRNTLRGDAPNAVAGPCGPSMPPEPTWADRQREQLPPYVTSGFYRDLDGNADVVQSGQEAQGEARARLLVLHRYERCGRTRHRGVER